MFKISRIVIFIVVSLTVLFFYLAYHQARHINRDPKVLMTRYSLLKKSNPEAAQKALELILQQDGNYQPALTELAALNLRENNSKAALPLLIRLHQLQPRNLTYTLSLAHLFYEAGNWQAASSLYHSIKDQNEHARLMLEKMASYLPYYREQSVSTSLHRDFASPAPEPYSKTEQILLSYFYKLKTEEPLAAESLLRVLNIMMNDNPMIYEERGYVDLQKHTQQLAISNFQMAYQLKPSPRLALQLAYLYFAMGDKSKAKSYFLIASASKEIDITKPALKAYLFLQAEEQEKTAISQLIPAKPSQPMSRQNLLLDQFYSLKKRSKPAAWQLIQQITQEFPDNLLALREAGYLAIDLHYNTAAIEYFTRAFALTSEPGLALQLGYLYDQTTDKYTAYHYFKWATKDPNKAQELKAQNAMTNLAGLQTKVLPEPYFYEVFFTPFTQSRFGLTVRPLIMRLGVELNDYFTTHAYTFMRQTDDNKSGNFGQIPQIYEDNVRIIGTGVQISPVAKFPLIAFIEAGGAYDLFYRNRARWRGDLRSGLMYYNEFGARPAYFDQFRFTPDYYSTIYSDITYFSRFDNNVIGTLKTHQGVHLIQYHSSIVNFYLSGRVIEDTNRDFFNNIAEIGPGIGIIPSNRFRLELRLEHINGVYLPVGGSQNPYGKYYVNRVAQLLFYAKI